MAGALEQIDAVFLGGILRSLRERLEQAD